MHTSWSDNGLPQLTSTRDAVSSSPDTSSTRPASSAGRSRASDRGEPPVTTRVDSASPYELKNDLLLNPHGANRAAKRSNVPARIGSAPTIAIFQLRRSNLMQSAGRIARQHISYAKFGAPLIVAP